MFHLPFNLEHAELSDFKGSGSVWLFQKEITPVYRCQHCMEQEYQAVASLCCTKNKDQLHGG